MPQVKLISPITRQEIRKVRVAAYCRVSSNSADQQNSYTNQIRVYTSLIQRKKEWELVEIFADEGLSGMNAQNRTEFQRMIKMCEQHQIDLIVTKSVSRFARNAKESLEYVRKLKLLGVGVQFEKEGIYTLALGDEMLLNTFSAIAQEESKAISQNQRLSIVKRMQSGEYVDSNAPYGFRLVDKALVVYEPEAVIVRMMFENYLSGQSTSEIARDLNSRGIKTKTGKSTWRSTKVAYILGNERYCGDCKYQKTYRDTTVPFKQFRNRGQEDNKGNPYLKSMLCEVGWVISGKRTLHLSGWYWKIKQRKGAKRATIALARKLLALIYTMLKTGSPYSEECFETRRKQSERKRAYRMVNELQKLGYFVLPPD